MSLNLIVSGPPSLNSGKPEIEDLRRNPLLTREEEIALAQRIRSGDDKALVILQQRNIGLLVSIARFYSRFGADFDDLFQEGAIALAFAAERFEPDRGSRFSSYAGKCIRGAILTQLSKSLSHIKIPPEVQRDIRKLNKFENKILASKGCLPEDVEIMKELGINKDKLKDLREVRKLFNLTSLDEPVNFDDSQETKQSMMADPNLEPVSQRHISKERADAVQRAIDSAGLTELQRRLVVVHFGLEGEVESSGTYDDTARRCQVGQERVKQNLAKAFRKISVAFNQINLS